MSEKIRLQAFLARAGVASRRKAEQMIAAGQVTVNGTTVTEMGLKVASGKDRVEVGGRVVQPETNAVYILFHKPAGTITSREDPQGRPTIFDLIEGIPEHLLYAGRLDYDTEGALLLTNDGPLIHALTHPSHKMPKIYQVKVQGLPSNHALDRLRTGVKLEDGPTAPADVDVFRIAETNSWLKITLREGRKNQIKRMLLAVGHRTLRIIRTHFAGVSLGNLEPGTWRHLKEWEMEKIHGALGQQKLGRAPKDKIKKRARGNSPSAATKGGKNRVKRKSK